MESGGEVEMKARSGIRWLGGDKAREWVESVGQVEMKAG